MNDALTTADGCLMVLHEEIRHFMVVSETLLDGSLKIDDLTNIEVDLIQYYLLEIDKKFSSYPLP